MLFIILEWKLEYKGIRHKVFSVDKDLGKQLQINKASSNKSDVAALLNSMEKAEFEREKERDSIFKQIKLMKSENDKFREKLKSFEKTPIYLQKIQLMSESLEAKMTEFKQQ